MDSNLTLNSQTTSRVKDVPTLVHEESLVSDARGRMTPAEQIERKLSRLLQDTPVPLSHQTHTRRLGRQR